MDTSAYERINQLVAYLVELIKLVLDLFGIKTDGVTLFPKK